MSKFDLHSHSNYSSDGEIEVKALLDMAKEAKLDIYAISDHNTVLGAREAQKIKDNYPFKLIPAIEIDCVYKNVELHLLGYGIDLYDDNFEIIRKNVEHQYKNASKQYIQKISDLGIYIDIAKLEENCPDGIIVAEDIAEVVLNDPINGDNELLLPYRENGPRSQGAYVNFYWDFCSQGKAAYVPVEFITLDEAIKIIHQAKGICVLAHPGINFANKDDYVEEIMELVEGIEAYSSYHDEKQIDKYCEIAIKHQKLITVGSDFHGKTKPHITIGMLPVKHNETELIEQFIEAIKKASD